MITRNAALALGLLACAEAEPGTVRLRVEPIETPRLQDLQSQFSPRLQ